LSSFSSVAEQHVDERHREGELADAQRRAEIVGPERQGAEDADEEAREEDEQLAAHGSKSRWLD
jgi:hypothetical protein